MTDRYSIRGQDDYWAVSDDCGEWNVINGIRTKIEAQILCGEMNKLENENRQLEAELERYKELNIPIDKIRERTVDYLERTIGVYYND